MSSCCVSYQHIGVDCNPQLLLTDIDFNEEESTDTCQFINFSIREYVNEIRNKNPEKCWPFGSLGDRHKKVVSSQQSSESTVLSGQNWPIDLNHSEDTTELTEAPNLSEVENPTTGIDNDVGKIVDNGSTELTSCKVNSSKNRHENNVDEGDKIRDNVAADNNEPGRNRPRRKHQKFRLLSDIYKDPASELRAGCDRTNPENVNKRFVTEIEDDSDDDVTLAAYFKKRKGIEVTDSTLKKRNAIGVEEPTVDQDRKSNNESKDSVGKDSIVGPLKKKIRSDDMVTQTMPEHNKLQCSQKSKQFAEVSSKEGTEKEKEKENEDFEMEAVMLLARHFNEKQILRECRQYPQSGLGPLTDGPLGSSPVTSLLGSGPKTSCACAKKRIRKHSTQSGNKPVTKTSSKAATKHPGKTIFKEKLKNATCSVQKRSFMPVKATTLGGFQSHFETSMTKATAGVGPDAQNRAMLICSFNRNPADFLTPDAENEFMRGG